MAVLDFDLSKRFDTAVIGFYDRFVIISFHGKENVLINYSEFRQALLKIQVYGCQSIIGDLGKSARRYAINNKRLRG